MELIYQQKGAKSVIQHLCDFLIPSSGLSVDCIKMLIKTE